MNFLGIFVKNLLTINVKSYLGALIPFSWCIRLLLCITILFKLLSFFRKFEIRNGKSSNFILLFQDCLTILEDPEKNELHFHKNLRIHSSTSAKRAAGIWIGIKLNLEIQCVESQEQFRGITILIYSSNLWIGDVFPFYLGFL